jgi:hypothetical protein
MGVAHLDGEPAVILRVGQHQTQVGKGSQTGEGGRQSSPAVVRHPKDAPLPAFGVKHIVMAVDPFEFDRVSGAFWSMMNDQDRWQRLGGRRNAICTPLGDEERRKQVISRSTRR